ncbi:MAG TPA: bifunctional riboflavin kinase/FAD synthetase [Sedimentisphaerales bacterium]|nr:bifunctional riboflavin kinase/FAD synthetase [Sedimentisphaerales bacterium]
MEIIETNSDLSQLAKLKKGCVLTIGNFDGVHLGHQEIINVARKLADQRHSDLVLMTFEPHPVAILYPEKAPGVLTPIALKKHLLNQFGVDCLVVLESSYGILNLSPESFVDEFLLKSVQPDVVVEGEDFNFGYGRSGNVRILKGLGQKFNFEIVIVPGKEIKLTDEQNARVSSTLIRHLLHKGKVADAAKALGRYYRLSGQTTLGKGKGRKLGFPTANIDPVNQIIPAEGVYAGFVEITDTEEQLCESKSKLPAAFSIGRAKTFISDHPLLVEAHILGQDPGDLYGKYLAMDFVEFIRHQQKFDSPEHLSKQIAKDCENAKHILDTNEQRF